MKRSAIVLVLSLAWLGCGSADESADDGVHEFVANAGTNVDDNKVSAQTCPVKTCPSGHDEGAVLNTKGGNGQKSVETALSLNQHQIWSSELHTDIPEVLECAGWKLVGDVILGGASDAIQAYVARDSCEGNLVVVFRGTMPSSCWDDVEPCLKQLVTNVFTDVSVVKQNMAWAENSEVGAIKIHGGFNSDYAAVRDQVWDRINQYPDDQIYVTGFSLGGALATLAALDIGAHSDRDPIMSTGGAPRVGQQDFVDAHQKYVPNSMRVVVNKDPIPMIPGYQPGAFDEKWDSFLLNLFSELIQSVGGKPAMWVLMKDFVHVGRLIQLRPNGQQMADDDIIVAIEEMDQSRHKHDESYRPALEGHLDNCHAGKNCAETVAQSANAERDLAADLESLKPW